MRITLTDEARQYLSSRSQHVTIYLAELTVQCCVPYSPPEVKLGRPEPADDSVATDAGGITVHVPRCVADFQDDLTLAVRGFGPFKTLALEGWRAFGVMRP
ncbi:MAG TPA: CC/Se motif family (seleno)protein [Symbiobacteriaceae bacterium]|nr:CC/Se motif family (seleno)protein [Symbiobacteriaceae bacterium]